MTRTILSALLLAGLTAPVYAATETAAEKAALAEAIKDTAAEEKLSEHMRQDLDRAVKNIQGAERDVKHAMGDVTKEEAKMAEEMAEEAVGK